MEKARKHQLAIDEDRLETERDNDDVRLALLIYLLPELEILRVHSFGSSKLSLGCIHIERMMDRRLISTKLREWERRIMGAYGACLRSTMIVPVMLYPSMEVIKAYHVGIDSRRTLLVQDGQWARAQSNYGQSNVDTIEFYDSGVSIQELTGIFHLCKALKRFIYRNGEMHHGNTGISIRTGMECALDHVAQTLELFDVEWNRVHEEEHDQLARDRTFCSMHKLASLRILRIRLSLLASYDLLTHPTPSCCLADLLPPHLETLVVYPTYSGQWSAEEYFKCLSGIVESKTSIHLPYLRTITCIRQNFPLPSWLIQLAGNRDICITAICDET
jgi:hypothetical protein